MYLTEQCKDIDAERCEVARKGGYCENYKLKANVSKQCPKSCGVCGMYVCYKQKYKRSLKVWGNRDLARILDGELHNNS